jgi:hypothetical protein
MAGERYLEPAVQRADDIPRCYRGWASGRGVVELADVGAGAEGAPVAGDHRGAQGGVLHHARQGADQPLGHGSRQRIHQRVIHQDQSDIAHALQPHRLYVWWLAGWRLVHWRHSPRGLVRQAHAVFKPRH